MSQPAPAARILQSALTSRRVRIVNAVFALLVGFIVGFIVAEIAYRYFEIERPNLF